MRSDRLLISLGLFLLTIALFVPVVFIGKAEMTDDNSKSSCEGKNPASPYTIGEPCYKWENNICLKGKIVDTGGSCEKKASIPGMILVVLAAISFITCLVYLGMGLFGKAKKGKRSKK